jgi:hypothetical protein
MTREVAVHLPGWMAWPRTVWVPDEAAVQTSGALEPPGPFVFLGAIYLMLFMGLLWFVAGTPGHIMKSWLGIGLQLESDHAPGVIAAVMIVLAVPVYNRLWWPAMIRRFGERFCVIVTEDTVTVQRGGRLGMSMPRDPEELEVVLEEHQLAKAAARAQPGHEGSNNLYRHSFEAVIRLAETRIVIASVSGGDEELGRALVLRVKSTILNFAKIAQASGGPVRGPVAADEDVYE